MLITGYFVYNRSLFHELRGIYGSQLQWFGYEERGNKIIETSLNNVVDLDAQLYHTYSVQNTKNGNYDEAIRFMNTAAELDSSSADGYFGWILLFYYRDYEKALFHLNRLDHSTAFVDHVSDMNILYAKGLCYKQLGKYEQALDLFKQSLDYERKEVGEDWINHQMYFQTGRTLHLLERHSEAIEYYVLAINSWNGSSESIYYKGLAEIEMGLDTGCKNLKLALEKVRRGRKSSDMYVRQFDEIYVGQVEEMIALRCIK